MLDSLRELCTFLEELFGDEAMANVVLVTTKWALKPGEGEMERELQLKDKHWKSMLDRGSVTARFMNTYESAWQIMGLLVFKERPRLLQIQRARVDQGKSLQQTSNMHRRRRNVFGRLFSRFFAG
jgi:hypothetical protein